MTPVSAPAPESAFMHSHIPEFLDRFCLSYFREDACVEYSIHPLCSDETISTALIFSYNPRRKDLHVSRFYPELKLLPDSKYLSATCFYLLIQHCASLFFLDNTCHISLETVQETNKDFYSKLRDFNFTISKSEMSGYVELMSEIVVSTVDTSMIRPHHLEPGEIPFLKE